MTKGVSKLCVVRYTLLSLPWDRHSYLSCYKQEQNVRGTLFIIYSPLYVDGEKINFRTPKNGI